MFSGSLWSILINPEHERCSLLEEAPLFSKLWGMLLLFAPINENWNSKAFPGASIHVVLALSFPKPQDRGKLRLNKRTFPGANMTLYIFLLALTFNKEKRTCPRIQGWLCHLWVPGRPHVDFEKLDSLWLHSRLPTPHVRAALRSCEWSRNLLGSVKCPRRLLVRWEENFHWERLGMPNVLEKGEEEWF